jgi:hypothetical protein
VPDPSEPGRRSTMRERRKRFQPSLSTWIIGPIVILLLVVGIATNGFPGFVVTAGVAGFLTVVHFTIIGRISWAAASSRRLGAVAIAGSLVFLIAGGVASVPPGNDGLSIAEASSVAGTLTAASEASPSRTTEPTQKPATGLPTAIPG